MRSRDVALLWFQLGVICACAPEIAPVGLSPSGVSGAGGAAATSSLSPRVRGALIVPQGWRQVEAAEDPFGHRPDVVDCPDEAVMPEIVGGRFAFGVETGSCHYFTGVHASLRNVLAGDEIQVSIAHFELTAPSPGEGHAAVLIDGLTVLDERVPIPRSADVIVRRLRVDRAIPAGSPVLFHVHNHGANSWAIVEVSTGP